MKSKLTKDIERALYNRIDGRAHVACHEITIGSYGLEIVDFMTVSSDKYKEIACYEIKVSKSDFYSKSKLSFVGHKNYFVMPLELYDKVKKDIPKGVGVYAFDKGYIKNVKRATYSDLKISSTILLGSFIRSLNREFYKALKLQPFSKSNRLGNKIIGEKE